MIKTIILILILTISFYGNEIYSQTKHQWTKSDRKFLMDNLDRTKFEVINETKNLTTDQWAFREDSTKWTIGQVLEHLGLYERIFAQEADIMLSAKPRSKST